MGKTKIAPATFDDVVKELAESHRANDPDTISVYLARDPEMKEIRLIEVTDSVGTTGEVLPFHFKAQPKQGIPYPSAVILLSRDEWRKIEQKKLKLPDEWASSELELLYEKK